ncbi:MAG TPA: Crp/Fnr family transcriptional regulator [Tepidiformaceae bacterium]
MSSQLPPSSGGDEETRPANLLLAAVPSDEYEEFRELLETYPLRMRETLQEAGDPPDWVYFPTSGVISVLTVFESGMMIEFATIGREGTSGVPIALAMSVSNLAFISQVPGSSLRMRSKDFLAAINRSPGFAAIIKRYSGMMLALVAQSAACNRAHHVDERCARWLLMMHDQTGEGAFPIPEEFLVQMLGVSRPAVELSAAALQEAGLISYDRGEMTIVDRLGLERAACECYAVGHEHFRRLEHSRDSI